MEIGSDQITQPLLGSQTPSDNYGTGSETPPDSIVLDRISITKTVPLPSAGPSEPQTCTQRVAKYLTPFNTVMVMLGSAFIAGVGVAVAKKDAQNGDYAGAEFVTGTAVATVGALGSTVSACRFASRNPTGLGCIGTPIQVGVLSLAMGTAGLLGYGVGGLVEVISGNWN